MRTMALAMRHALTPAIVLFWLVMVGLLVHKQAPPQSAPQAPLAAGTTPERDEWFGVERDGKRVGRAHRASARTATGLRFTEDLLVSLIMLGVPQTVRTSLDAETDDRFALRRVRFTLASPATAFSATGTSDGRRLTVTYGADGRSSEATILLTEPVSLPVRLRARVLAGDTTPGTPYTVPVFNPLALRDEPLTVKVDGRAALDGVDAIVLTEEQHDLRARVWLTPDGSVLREEGSLGLTLVRESREAALAGDAALVPLELVAASRIPVTGRIEDPRHVRRLTLRMNGAAPSAREVLAARRGDCNEHAVLLAALARAAGIPARVVAGAIYLDGAFYYHAWTELWLGTWVSADAVFRQLPTDATHVKLLEGGPERHMELAGIVGELRFTAEESQR